MHEPACQSNMALTVLAQQVRHSDVQCVSRPLGVVGCCCFLCLFFSVFASGGFGFLSFFLSFVRLFFLSFFFFFSFLCLGVLMFVS